jgi:LysM repeat protein
MPRTFHWKWVGLLAVTLTPGLAFAQAAAPQTHTVRQGDTLWDLAKHYRGDPFLWPDIYRLNTSVVEDPHWIYPGEVLVLAGGDSVPSVPTTDTPEPPAAVADAPADTAAPATTADAGQDAPQATLAQLTAVSANEPTDEDQGLFGPKRSKLLEQSLQEYTHQPYRPLRRSEFYSSGFLTENEKLPFGTMLGPVVPSQIRGNSANASALPNSVIAVEAPRGATYQIGDTLLVVQIGPELQSHGQIVMPTGLVRITDTVQGRYVANVVATYGPIRNGQRVLPAEKFTPSANEARAVPVTEGVRATFLGGPGRQDMKAPQMVVFLDKGREEGVAPGDLFEIRRTARRLPDGRQLVDDVMATLQVVHVRDHTATARLLNILSPDIAPGTGARQVAKLPS